jgi:nicotinate phosphoribosyltransferase
MVFDDEFDAFKEYAQALPGNAIFLVDTYDTIEGVKKAIEVGVWLRSQGKNFQGIRLDSGDLAYLSIRARQLLDENGFSDVKILASNELDETIISELKRQGAQITVWGVGTKLATGGNQPALDGVYKLSALRDPGGEWQDRIKLSEQMVKVSNPGILQVKRFIKEGEYIADMIYDINSPASNQIIDPFDPTLQRIISEKTESIDLLIPIYRQGKKVYSSPSLKQIKEKSEEELKFFHAGIKRFLNPHNYFVGLEKSLYERKVALIQSIRSQKL